ncbi:hypothetical protein [Roseibium salinum]|uniref:Uncharacterized protein n=1 Tax=Roseibium salinum TaxID=1604349 RepID=A0ABT3R2Y8_9HYPH|nr:hypothetical protein [Roseibium sp. DSM 29163]MCX2723337.1 hypothetical protein [Roseibium sp. DSM 29163]MDN3718765.1 hypothetical protein [Roseibium salinum]
MTERTTRSAEEKFTEKDQLNREFEQETQADKELESLVPPISKRTNAWRIGIAAVLVLVLAILVVQYV